MQVLSVNQSGVALEAIFSAKILLTAADIQSINSGGVLVLIPAPAANQVIEVLDISLYTQAQTAFAGGSAINLGYNGGAFVQIYSGNFISAPGSGASFNSGFNIFARATGGLPAAGVCSIGLSLVQGVGVGLQCIGASYTGGGNTITIVNVRWRVLQL